MTSNTSFVPPARSELIDPELWRPDWTTPESRDPRLLWLDKNENTDPALAVVTARVLAEMDPRSVAVYPDCAPLYAKLAEHLGVTARSLLLAPGSDGVIGSVFRTFVAPGDCVLHTLPTYRMYAVYARMSGARTVTVGYERGSTGPSLSVESLTRVISESSPKLVCLPNPDSPTGTVLAPDAIEAVVATALDVGAVILIDEAYYPFHAHTVLPLISKYSNLIVARTFSKAWGLTGVRLGYGVTSPQMAVLMHKVRPNYEVNMVAVQMAVRMLSDFEGEMMASVRRLNVGRDSFLAAMQELGLRTLTSHGSFAHVAFDGFGERVHSALANIALYTRNLGPPLDGFSRFSATTPDLFRPVIEGIRRVVREMA